MSELLVFISSFGFGHLTRTIAIIRELLRKDSFEKIHLLAPQNHCDFFNRSISKEFSRKIQTYNIVSDVGLYYDNGSIRPNIRKSITNGYEFYHKMRKNTLKKIRKIIKRIKSGIVYSDASPLAFDIAKEYNFDSLLVSNFDWSSVYRNLECENAEQNKMKIEICEILEEAYNKNSKVLQLPLSNNDCFSAIKDKEVQEIGFFSRRKTVNRNEFLTKNEMDDKYTIFISFGKNINYNLNFGDTLKVNLDKYNILTSNINQHSDFIFSIPKHETESQNWVGNCDLFIGKPGWGTISECVMNNVKMILVSIAENIESRVLIDKALKLGGTISINSTEFSNMNWLKKIKDVNSKKYNSDLDLTGKEQVTAYIESIM